LLHASLRLTRRELSRSELTRLALLPSLSFRTTAAIYAQAWKLRRKGVPSFVHDQSRSR
jgi:DUF1365 family protein